MIYTAEEIAGKIGAEIRGDSSVELVRICGIEEAGHGDLTFIANNKYRHFLNSTGASAVIAASGTDCDRMTLLLHADPYFAFMKAVEMFNPGRKYSSGIHSTAVIVEPSKIDPSAHIGPNAVVEDGVEIGKNSVILANVFLGQNTIIGDNCLIYPNVTIRESSRIGDRVIIHSCTAIGSDGFGYATSGGVHHKIQQVGCVVIEDDVEIGANVAIDRGTLGETRIGCGTKVDNHVQIAHNVRTGKGCIIVSQVGVSGSTKLGNHVVVGGQVGFVGHIEVGDGAQIGAQSGVSKSVSAGKIIRGSPASDIKQALKIEACMKKLPDHVKLLKELDKKVRELTDGSED